MKMRKYSIRAKKAAANPIVKYGVSQLRKSKYGSTMDKIDKASRLVKDQQLMEGLAMPAIRTAVQAIDLFKRQSPGRTLPAFSGNNRKVVIPTVSTGTVSTSVYGYKYNDRPIPRKTGDVNTVVRKNSQYTSTVSAGYQNVLDVPLLSCSNLSSGTDNYTSVSFENAFETVFNVGGSNPTIVVPASARDQNRIALDRFESTLKITGDLAAPVEITIYDLLPKRDVPRATYSSRVYANGLQSPFQTWQSGMSNAVDIDDTQNPAVLGTIPTNNLKFNTFWKVMKRTKVELSAGSTHIHRGCNILNTLFNYYDYSEVLGLRSMLCPTIMIVFNGLPTSTEISDSVTISYSTENVLFARSAVNDNITVRNYDASTT